MPIRCVRDNQVTDSHIGISLSQGAPLVERNTVEGGDAGIVVTGGTPTLTDNSVKNATGRGFAIGANTDAVLAGNSACGNGTDVWQPKGAEPIPSDAISVCAAAPAG